MIHDLRIKRKNWKKTLVVKDGETYNIETVSEYAKPNENGRVEVKAVVMDGGVLNLKGVIKIRKGAWGTDAFLKQDVLLVGENARAVAEPQLEIETDDVKASHAAAVGQIDPEQIFYLRSKGLSEAEAKEEIINAFLVSDQGK